MGLIRDELNKTYPYGCNKLAYQGMMSFLIDDETYRVVPKR